MRTSSFLATCLALSFGARILADQIPGTGITLTITDPSAASLPLRFYRAVVLP